MATSATTYNHSPIPQRDRIRGQTLVSKAHSASDLVGPIEYNLQDDGHLALARNKSGMSRLSDILVDCRDPPKDDTGRYTEEALRVFFEGFNNIFFFSQLPTPMLDQTAGDYTNPPRVIIDHGATYPAKIILFRAPSSDAQIGDLLGGMIELYLKWYSCPDAHCQTDINACGKAGRGWAWQSIAYKIENSDDMQDINTALSIQVDLRREEAIIRELSYWDARNSISRWQGRKWNTDWNDARMETLIRASEDERYVREGTRQFVNPVGA